MSFYAFYVYYFGVFIFIHYMYIYLFIYIRIHTYIFTFIYHFQCAHFAKTAIPRSLGDYMQCIFQRQSLIPFTVFLPWQGQSGKKPCASFRTIFSLVFFWLHVSQFAHAKYIETTDTRVPVTLFDICSSIGVHMYVAQRS